MAGGKEPIEVKFRLFDGTDIGPSKYDPSTTVSALKEFILARWPQDKEITPKTVNDLKLINAGRILENNRTLAESRVPVGEVPGGVITMHVVVRPPQPDKNSEKQLANSPKQNRCGCTILPSDSGRSPISTVGFRRKARASPGLRLRAASPLARTQPRRPRRRKTLPPSALSLSGSASRAPWKRPPVAGARPPVGDPTALYKRDRLERPDPSLARGFLRLSVRVPVRYGILGPPPLSPPREEADRPVADSLHRFLVWWSSALKTAYARFDLFQATRIPQRVICASNSYSSNYRSTSTSSPMNSNEMLGAQETVSTEGNNSCSSVQSTPDIEKKYVHRVYDAIAPHFSSTRFAKWPKVAGFLNSLRPGSVILDAGCGNGKYLGFNPDCLFIGCDISPPLIDICAGRGHEVLVADAVNLPYRDNFGDAAISIAVLHHLSTDARRRKAIEELIRVVRKGGLVLITVWAVEQEDKSLLNKWTPLCEKYNEEWVDPSSPPVRNQSNTVLESISETDEHTGAVKQRNDDLKISNDGLDDNADVTCSNSNIDEHHKTQQEYFVPWHLPFHRAEIGGASAAALENGFAKRDDKKGTVVYNRYYHVFVEGELQRLVAGINNAVVVDQFYDKSNWCIVLEKL
uniref:Ubiquitin-like domain-containing protein n=2 Tax=Oryza TaxID=4527 RepID=A0A0E0HL57_ORYNI